MTTSLDSRFEAFVAEHGNFLRQVIARKFPRRLGLDVDDIVQEARIRIWQALRSEKKIENPASYVYRIAVTVTIDAVRRFQARKDTANGSSRSASSGDDEQDPLERLPDPAPSPERQAELAQELARIESALARLPGDRATAVRFHLQGYGVEEVAFVTGWTPARARNLVYRGLADLREALRAEGIEYETD